MHFFPELWNLQDIPQSNELLGQNEKFFVLLQNASILKILSRNFIFCNARFFGHLELNVQLNSEIAPPGGPANSIYNYFTF